jgi:VanZ family protein
MKRPPRRLLVGLFWILVVVVGVLALLPARYPMPSTGWDKANHALAFAVLGVLGNSCWPERRMHVILALAAYGGAIEIAQTFTETRLGEWLDWCADLAGLLLAVAAHAVRRR